MTCTILPSKETSVSKHAWKDLDDAQASTIYGGNDFSDSIGSIPDNGGLDEDLLWDQGLFFYDYDLYDYYADPIYGYQPGGEKLLSPDDWHLEQMLESTFLPYDMYSHP